jgi:sphingomyelin phosphodiesterase
MCCRSNFGAKRGVNSTLAGPLGDYNCDASLALFEQSVSFAASLTSDFVLFTGDLPAHDVWNQSLSRNVHVLSQGTELLSRAFGASKTLLPSLGNHDTFPADAFAPQSSTPIYAAIHKIWTPLLPEAALNTVALGGYYR